VLWKAGTLGGGIPPIWRQFTRYSTNARGKKQIFSIFILLTVKSTTSRMGDVRPTTSMGMSLSNTCVQCLGGGGYRGLGNGQR
jgi:hypothetical protein